MMRRIFCVLGVGVMMSASGVFAQPTDRNESSEIVVHTSRRSALKAFPTPSQAMRDYPKEAKRQGVTGMAKISCLWNEKGRLKCTLISETPEGYGFGAATVAIFETYGRIDMRQTKFLPDEGEERRFRYHWGERKDGE